MGRGAAAALHAAHAATYRQMCIVESHAWQRAVLGGTVVSPEEAGAVQCAQFDSQGELLVAGSEEGLLTVHATAALLAACHGSGSGSDRRAAASPGSGSSGGGAPGPGQQAVGTADPLLVLDSHMPKLQAVAWNPSNENVVGLVASTSRTLPLYDLQHTQVGVATQRWAAGACCPRPSRRCAPCAGALRPAPQCLAVSPTLSVAACACSPSPPASSASTPSSSQGRPQQVLAVPPQSAAAVGLTDLAFFGGSATAGGATASSYVVLASGSGGQVFLWEARARAAPAATLAAAQGSGALYAVQLAPDGLVVAAGSQSGEVKLWDLRYVATVQWRQYSGGVHAPSGGLACFERTAWEGVAGHLDVRVAGPGHGRGAPGMRQGGARHALHRRRSHSANRYLSVSFHCYAAAAAAAARCALAGRCTTTRCWPLTTSGMS